MKRHRNDWFEHMDDDAFEAYTELHRNMSMSQKLARIFELTAEVQAIVTAEIRRDHPDAGEREIFLRVAATRLDRESMINVYGWDPALHS